MGRPRLVKPLGSHHQQWRACLREFAGGATDGSGFTSDDTSVHESTSFEEYLAHRRAAEDPATPLPDGWVHCTFHWIVDESFEEGGPILGFLSLRHRLTPALHECGGHIGYSVRPSARGRGVASAALVAGVEAAAARGIDPVLVTCRVENVASRRVIERAGGDLEDERGGFLRFWVGSGERPAAP